MHACACSAYNIVCMVCPLGSVMHVDVLHSILRKFSVAKYDKNVKEVGTEKIQKDFLTMEEQEVRTRSCALYGIHVHVYMYA